jgi:uncharacterized protein (DUF1697 family)
MTAHVALLRGINVGGKNSLPMKDLVRLFEKAGCKSVRTYIQSGNVVFEASDALAARVPRAIAAAILTEAELEIPVVTRSVQELAAALKGNPYLKGSADPTRVHFAFLADAPSRARVASLDPKRSPPDEFVVKGRDVFLHLPNGVGKSKLTNAYLDSKLGTVSTLRNLATVQKLVLMGVE